MNQTYLPQKEVLVDLVQLVKLVLVIRIINLYFNIM